MFFRIAGTLLVMAGSVGIGFYLSAKERFRVQDLLEFKKGFMILSSEIEHMRCALPTACANISKRTSGGVSGVFARFAEILNDGDETAYQAWLVAMQNSEIWLAAEDRTILEDFGKTLGYLDKKMQQNAIDHVVAYIDEKTAQLSAQSAKTTRMYRSLGAVGGLLLAVVLW